MLQLKAVQLQVTNISSGWLHGDHCRLDALWNEPCEICEGIYLTISPMVSIHVHPCPSISGLFACKAKAFSWQESQHRKYCAIQHPFRKQEPYRYSVSFRGLSRTADGPSQHQQLPENERTSAPTTRQQRTAPAGMEKRN